MNQKDSNNEDEVFTKMPDVSFSSMIGRHLDRIGFLSSRIDVNDVSTVNNFTNAVKAFEKFLIHKQDADFRNNKDSITRSRTTTLDKSYEILGELMKLMSRSKLFGKTAKKGHE